MKKWREVREVRSSREGGLLTSRSVMSSALSENARSLVTGSDWWGARNSKARKWFTAKPRHPQTEDNEREKKEDIGLEKRLNTSCSGHQQERDQVSERVEPRVRRTDKRWPLGLTFWVMHRQTLPGRNNQLRRSKWASRTLTPADQREDFFFSFFFFIFFRRNPLRFLAKGSWTSG